MATPREAGFFMPAEWAPHAGCWMAWPCRPENWDDIERARATYVEIARAVARFEPVTMTANAADLRQARRALAGTPGAEVVELPALSAHADAAEILDWLRTAPKPPIATYLNHGEPGPADALRQRIEHELKWSSTVPLLGQRVELQ